MATAAYSVFPAHRGKGVAPRAVRLMAEWAFGDLGLSEVLLEIDPANAASVRVAQKCGFEPADHGPTGPGVPPNDGKLVFAARRGARDLPALPGLPQLHLGTFRARFMIAKRPHPYRGASFTRKGSLLPELSL